MKQTFFNTPKKSNLNPFMDEISLEEDSILNDSLENILSNELSENENEIKNESFDILTLFGREENELNESENKFNESENNLKNDSINNFKNDLENNLKKNSENNLKKIQSHNSINEKNKKKKLNESENIKNNLENIESNNIKNNLDNKTNFYETIPSSQQENRFLKNTHLKKLAFFRKKDFLMISTIKKQKKLKLQNYFIALIIKIETFGEEILKLLLQDETGTVQGVISNFHFKELEIQENDVVLLKNVSIWRNEEILINIVRDCIEIL